MGRSCDRPGGMDDKVPANPTPKMKTPGVSNSDMGAAASVAAGPVDSGSGKSIANIPAMGKTS